MAEVIDIKEGKRRIQKKKSGKVPFFFGVAVGVAGTLAASALIRAIRGDGKQPEALPESPRERLLAAALAPNLVARKPEKKRRKARIEDVEEGLGL